MFLRNKTGVNAPPGVNGLLDDDRIPVIKVVSGDSWVVDAVIMAADGCPANPKNSHVEFVLSENQFSPPIWTGEWINGVLPDENMPGLVHIRIPGEITKSIRRGSYMFSLRVSDPMKFTFSTQLKGNFLVEYMPTSDHRSIPYRDGTSDIFGGSQQEAGGTSGSGGGGNIDIEGYDELLQTVEQLQISLAQKADRTSVYSKEETGAIVQEGVSKAVADVVDGAPTALDTLKEIADWIGNDHSGATQAIADKVDKVDGMGLSHNDFTDADKEKVDNLKAVATTGSYSDLYNTPEIPTVPTAYASTPKIDGFGSAGSSTEWARGDHVHPTDTSRAAATDLPYALVKPGEWEFSDGGAHTISAPYEDYGEWAYELDGQGYISDDKFSTEADALAALSLTFSTTEGQITATRASLPGHLCDRAGNRVVVSGYTTLTLPAANPGYLRDFLVRLEISGSTVPTITFAAPTGETLTYETDGDEFPVPDEAGDWLYSFTESCVAHTFAVSLKKVNEVAQGGS